MRIFILFAFILTGFAAQAEVSSQGQNFEKGLRGQYPKAWRMCHTYCAGKYRRGSRYRACMKTKGYSCGILATKGVFYGNYCGIGNYSPKKPINVLDKTCKVHDLCWEREGDWNCGCDRELARSAKKISRNRDVSRKVREYAEIVAAFWDDSPCQR